MQSNGPVDSFRGKAQDFFSTFIISFLSFISLFMCNHYACRTNVKYLFSLPEKEAVTSPLKAVIIPILIITPFLYTNNPKRYKHWYPSLSPPSPAAPCPPASWVSVCSLITPDVSGIPGCDYTLASPQPPSTTSLQPTRHHTPPLLWV